MRGGTLLAHARRLTALAALFSVAAPRAFAGEPLPRAYATWPKIESAVPKSAALEARITEIMSGMTLPEKIGQMTQPEAPAITPAEVTRHYIGSILSGGDAFPNRDRLAPAAAWMSLADAYWEAAMATDARVKIPIMWGIDAVHGHAKVYGATVFPHNIGLGATRDFDLVRRIGAATALQLRATGHDWTFAPCVAVVRDYRWGRAYEGFAEDPLLVKRYAEAMVAGLQAPRRAGSDVRALAGVLATAKHYIGDGGTTLGNDQGHNASSELELINIHGPGYFGAIAAGVQTIMVSFNSWGNPHHGDPREKLHGSKYLLDEVLKTKIGFDGVLVSDWNGIGQVAGCSNTRCAKAINAGIDVFMVPSEWRRFIADTIDLVQRGEVSMTRIDDAVRRILRVKLRAGLFAMPKPSARSSAGLEQAALAAEAVQKSAVLLKNNGAVLPISRRTRILVVGKSADSIANQTGGWTLSWQGSENKNQDFPGKSTVLDGIRAAAGEANVVFSPDGVGVEVSDFGAVIAVIGERPYAEMKGDIAYPRTISHAEWHPEDLEVLRRMSGKGAKVVTVFISGRPLYTNAELNLSDAFVAAWLLGTEGRALAELLFRRADGEVDKDFTGKLSFSWPQDPCQSSVNIGDRNYRPLFPYGYGLGYGDRVEVARLMESSAARCFWP